MKLHVANLSPKVTEGLLRELFGQFGEVVVLKLSWTRAVNRTAGTAVVEMGSAVEATAAAKALNGRPFRSRRLYISAFGAQQPPRTRRLTGPADNLPG